MNAKRIGLLTETMMHPGSGQHNGAIDLPVARESTTDYPVVVGSSMKGALRDKMVQEKKSQEVVSRLFGKQSQAGAVAVTDGRLLLLPVRSLQGVYRWVTCPYLWERFSRDSRLSGSRTPASIPEVTPGEVLVAEETETLFLEELSLEGKRDADCIVALAAEIKPLIRHKSAQERLEKQLVVVSDQDFAYLARYSLPVQIRNQLSEEKTSKKLWSEETLPPDTLLYALLISRPAGESGESSLETVLDHLQENPYLQIGGNETLGQGWCIISTEGRQE